MGRNADGLAVTYDGLDFAATNLANEAKLLDEDIQHLTKLVQDCQQYWEGKAHGAFNVKLTAWRTETTAIHEALMGIGHVVGTSGGTYMEGDLAASKYLQ
ncbi:WXG100 family type VII secretion target [Streptomyces coelicoflavus]|uniref:WXG100 family type VII secretion target n=1 Tax=Streptomyces TaxID=1883 RepID=UPI001292B47C|nr:MULTISPECIES: WXG100 family type VII secretion target [Streptomyces]MCX5034970.1 WXG100 family type VII secretion target [Streptomyces coelicoflavus]MDI6520886.1 WXG100 family type VII secretion target [Streptomyces coelicoflavus]QFX81329.1 WXG100 family type VII secretion target [Streptomyces sp. SYP-A7193]